MALCMTLAVGIATPAVAAVPVPREARAVDTSHPDRWVGTGTRRSCTSRALVRAVAKGGIIGFRCGPDPVRIELRQTAKVVNTSRRVVLDGRGLVTLSGGGSGGSSPRTRATASSAGPRRTPTTRRRLAWWCRT
jgi:hypothetical protein